MKKAILKTEKTMKIIFDYDPQTVCDVKRLAGRKFHSSPGSKYWTAPLSIDNVQLLKSLEFELGGELASWLKKKSKKIKVKEIEIPGLRGELYPFQKEGVHFIEARDGRALLGDEMGLGKTIQALAYLQLHPELRPAIVVCPASVKLNWKKEIVRWMPNAFPTIISGKKGIALNNCNSNIIIINYDILTAWESILSKLNPKVIILDEGHFIKNRTAARTKTAKRMCKKIPHIIALSGTPIINKPMEMFNTINLIEPGIFPSFWDYAQQYCGAKHNGFGWQFDGATNTEELHKKLVDTIMLRRFKKDVLKDLPAKVRAVIPLQITNRIEYDRIEDDLIDWVSEGKKDSEGAEALVKIERLKQATIKGKMKACIQWIEDFLESGEKLVVFCTHKNTIEQLEEHFETWDNGGCCVRLDGSTPLKGRQAAVDNFQQLDCVRLFIGNIKAAGIGITLTAASNTCFLELGWTPGEHDQAEDRVHRIGQEADSVNAWYLIAEGTIEEDICELLDSKRKVLAAVLDGEEVDEESMLSKLLEKYKED